MAIFLVQTPSSFITTVMSQILFPSFAHVQNDKERVNRILITVTSWLTLLGLPAVVAICLCARSLLSVIYGTRYMAAAGPLAFAAAVVCLNVLNAAVTCVFSGIGRPALHRRAVAASAVAMLVAIYPACKLFGVVGGQIAALLAITLSYFLQVVRMREVTGLNLLGYARGFAVPALGSAGMLAVVLGGRRLGLTPGPTADVILCAGSCLITYALCGSIHLRASKRQDRLYGTETPETAPVL
jgi:O-antigen/teichoic acid export membrane protein